MLKQKKTNSKTPVGPTRARASGFSEVIKKHFFCYMQDKGNLPYEMSIQLNQVYLLIRLWGSVV